jgi:hypothetical protein
MSGDDHVMPRGDESSVKMTGFPVVNAESPENQLVCLGSADSSWGWLCDLRWSWIWRRSPVDAAAHRGISFHEQVAA